MKAKWARIWQELELSFGGTGFTGPWIEYSPHMGLGLNGEFFFCHKIKSSFYKFNHLFQNRRLNLKERNLKRNNSFNLFFLL